MIARFIGENFNGFIHGKIYTIRTDCKLVIGHGLKKPASCLCAYNSNNPNSWCPYSRLETFLKNWEIIDEGETTNVNINHR